jgi:hypothetical protein
MGMKSAGELRPSPPPLARACMQPPLIPLPDAVQLSDARVCVRVGHQLQRVAQRLLQRRSLQEVALDEPHHVARLDGQRARVAAAAAAAVRGLAAAAAGVGPGQEESAGQLHSKGELLQVRLSDRLGQVVHQHLAAVKRGGGISSARCRDPAAATGLLPRRWAPATDHSSSSGCGVPGPGPDAAAHLAEQRRHRKDAIVVHIRLAGALKPLSVNEEQLRGGWERGGEGSYVAVQLCGQGTAERSGRRRGSARRAGGPRPHVCGAAVGQLHRDRLAPNPDALGLGEARVAHTETLVCKARAGSSKVSTAHLNSACLFWQKTQAESWAATAACWREAVGRTHRTARPSAG